MNFVNNSLIFLLFITILSCSQGQSNSLEKQMNQLVAQLRAHPKQVKTYDAIHDLISNNYNELTANQRSEIRKTLRNYAIWSYARVAPNNEPGQKLIITGQLTDAQEKPIPNALLTIYHTDHRGYYTPNDSINKTMGENDARLFGYLRTDPSGHFEIGTVRPANYPHKYKGRFIPQHIHINTEVPGYKDLRLQMVFKDDPVMDNYWLDWAAKLGYPVVSLTYNNNITEGNCHIVIEKNE